MRSAGCRPLAITACAGLAVPGAAAHVEGSKALPPGYTTTGTGDVHDFDYFSGGWTTRQRRLKARGVDSTEWEEFPATLCDSLYLDGMVTVDELYFPTKGWAGGDQLDGRLRARRPRDHLRGGAAEAHVTATSGEGGEHLD